ncbi:hypothetical protein N7490_006968 [Penicillium lividum]|nr:hypothetical protein N7490_006968 [Penicillium lividum]
MPGFNVPLNLYPTRDGMKDWTRGFANALDPSHCDEGYMDQLVTHREILMMRVMNTITDKPSWDRKVFDEQITAKWRAEISQSGQDVSTKMMNWIIKELQWKAGMYQERGIIQVFDSGVVKSDTVISQQLQQALKDAVSPLENIPEKDYHPGSDQKVVNLVHPSLFPVIYGRTRVLPDRVIGLNDCLDNMGEGSLIPTPSEEHSKIPFESSKGVEVLSRKFQWLPCDVELTENNGSQILSYINNTHPIKHRALYEVIEKIIAQTVPLWDMSLTDRHDYIREQRIVFKGVEYGEAPGPYPKEPEGDGHEEWDKHVEDDWAHLRSRPIKQPEPGEFNTQYTLNYNENPVNLREDFKNQRLQVIVKLANIELTPEKPDYEGGTWHIEGQLNERICASAIYYYDSANITESTLSFRHRGMDDFYISYDQELHEFLQVIYGFLPEVKSGYPGSNITQLDGSVICKEGRLITFPNTLQHRVSPFSLADRTKPGHRKILALFLVDPHRRIISSANVPPQRKDWKDDEGDSEMDGLMSMNEAREYRLSLMEERSIQKEKNNSHFEEGEFNLCEH